MHQKHNNEHPWDDGFNPLVTNTFIIHSGLKQPLSYEMCRSLLGWITQSSDNHYVSENVGVAHCSFGEQSETGLSYCLMFIVECVLLGRNNISWGNNIYMISWLHCSVVGLFFFFFFFFFNPASLLRFANEWFGTRFNLFFFFWPCFMSKELAFNLCLAEI